MQPQMNQETNPLAPHAFAEALRFAFKALTAGLEIKITLYKLFDKVGSPGMVQCYAELNQLLDQAGVLPELRAPTATTSAKRRTRVTI